MAWMFYRILKHPRYPRAHIYIYICAIILVQSCDFQSLREKVIVVTTLTFLIQGVF